MDVAGLAKAGRRAQLLAYRVGGGDVKSFWKNFWAEGEMGKMRRLLRFG
jgi:hypothetical protein